MSKMVSFFRAIQGGCNWRRAKWRDDCRYFFRWNNKIKIFASLCRAADEFDCRLTDAGVESWHLHWIIAHGFDPVATMVGRLKNRMRQALNIGRMWTEGYYDSHLFEAAARENRSRYIGRHSGWRMTDGIVRRR